MNDLHRTIMAKLNVWAPVSCKSPHPAAHTSDPILPLTYGVPNIVIARPKTVTTQEVMLEYFPHTDDLQEALKALRKPGWCGDVYQNETCTTLSELAFPTTDESHPYYRPICGIGNVVVCQYAGKIKGSRKIRYTVTDVDESDIVTLEPLGNRASSSRRRRVGRCGDGGGSRAGTSTARR